MNVKIRKPFDGDYRITFPFGADPDWYVDRIGYPHNGVDFALPDATPVFACDEGVVIRVEEHPRGWGVFVRIQHDWGISHYAHLKDVTVELGETVDSDTFIARSDSTGWVTGPHLHFGIKVFGVDDPAMKNWVDPMPYFEGEEAVDTVVCPRCGEIILLVPDKQEG